LGGGCSRGGGIRDAKLVVKPDLSRLRRLIGGLEVVDGVGLVNGLTRSFKELLVMDCLSIHLFPVPTRGVNNCDRAVSGSVVKVGSPAVSLPVVLVANFGFLSRSDGVRGREEEAVVVSFAECMLNG
jgi:hypothetical protein